MVGSKVGHTLGPAHKRQAPLHNDSCCSLNFHNQSLDKWGWEVGGRVQGCHCHSWLVNLCPAINKYNRILMGLE